MIRTVLLDLDDTLYDFRLGERNALSETLTEFGIDPTEAVIRQYTEINAGLWLKLEQGLTTREALRLDRHRLFFEAIGAEVAHDAYERAYSKRLAERHYFIDGAEALLQALHGHYRLVLVTNGMTDIQNGRLASGGIVPYFDAIYISQDVGFNKPDPRFFDHLFDELPDLRRDETVIVGDSLTSDIRGGLNSGIHTIWFNPADTPADPSITPDATIRHLSELPEVLVRLGANRDPNGSDAP